MSYKDLVKYIEKLEKLGYNTAFITIKEAVSILKFEEELENGVVTINKD